MSEQAVQTSTSSGRGRTIGAWICFVLAALLLLPSLLAFWGQRTINDTARYVETVGPLIESDEVKSAISATVTTAIQDQVDVEAIINDVFAGVITDRPRLQQLVGPLAGAVNGLISRTVDEVVNSDLFADLWIQVNTRAQQRLTAVLRGEDTGAIEVQGDQVVLDVSDVIDEVKTRLVDRGLTIVENVPIPDTDKQIVLLTAPQLEQARTIYALTNPIATWAIWVVLALFLAAFLLSRRRPRMTVAVGLAFVVNALVLALALSVGRQLFVNELAGTVWGPASSVFWDTLLTFLIAGGQALLATGIVLVAAGWFAGRNRPGTASREFLAGALETPGRALADGPVGGAGRWVAGNAGWLRWVVVAVGVVALLAPVDFTVSRVLWTTLGVVVVLAVLQVLVGAGTPAVTAPDGASSGGAADGAEPSADEHPTLVTEVESPTSG